MPEVTMPRLSDTMQEGKVARWLKHPGDRVAPGDVLAEIETDKATMELESFEAGVLDRILVPEGQSAPIGQPIAVIGAGNGAATVPASGQSPAPAAAPTGSTETPPTATTLGQPPVGANPPAVQAETRPPTDAAGAEPAAQSVGAQPPQPDSTAQAGQPDQRSQPAPTTTPPQKAAAQAAPAEPAAEGRAPTDNGATPAAAPGARPGEASAPAAEQTPTGEEVRASPMARAIARERGIDLRRVRGSGPGGRIIRADLEAIGSNGHAPPASAAAPSGPAPAPAARSEGAVAPDTAPAAPPQAAAPSAAASPPSAPQGDGAEPRPVGRIHQVMAERTLQSVRDIPQYYLTSEVDMQAALDLRHELEQTFGSEARVTINAIVLRAVALALKEVPEVNSVWRDGQWLLHRQVHLGVAVAVLDGLIVPVVRDADRKSLREIAAETRALASRAREGKLSLAEVQGSTFSVTNLGMFDVEEFHGIINPPEAGLLAVGTVVDKPVGLDGQIVLRPRMRVTLTADHRAYSGDVGARFLQAVKRLLEQPLRLGF